MDPLAQVVITNVREVRKRMGLSAEALTLRLPASLGVSRNMLANLETGRRDHLSVDELAALASALEISDPWSLTRPTVPPCETCNDRPPLGFRCLTCDTAGAPPTIHIGE